MRSAAAVWLMVGLSAGAARSQPPPAMTVGDLAQLCAGEDHVSRNACRIYILGVTQGIAVGAQLSHSGSRAGPCVPPGVAADTLEETIKRRLEKEVSRGPGSGNRDAAGLIGSALTTAFPCTRPAN